MGQRLLFIGLCLVLLPIKAATAYGTLCTVADVYSYCPMTGKDVGASQTDSLYLGTLSCREEEWGSRRRYRITNVFTTCPTGTAKYPVKYCSCQREASGCRTLSCTACLSLEWTELRDGYQSRQIGGICSDNTCTSNGICHEPEIEYRCAPGYYGTTTDGATGCAPCPAAPAGAQTSAGGSTKITDCYIPGKVSYSDSNGTFEYTSNCHYTSAD